ncbi:hypothetical protein OB920_18485 [Halobacteria archaeon HArc-gm2]|nr:hypothetical protein [Halobacteria archaeon HArc-gm2]
MAEETLDIAQIVTSEPGLTTLQTLMDDPRQWTTSELVDTAGHQIEDHAIEETQEYAALHATLFSGVLPEMEREGIVTFERERGIVELTRPGYDYGQLLGLDGGTTTHDGVGRITGLELDELLDVYSSDRRQAVLAVLTELGGSGTLSEIVTEVAERETTEDMSEEQKQKRVWTSLRQLHMPRLDDSGLVDYIDVDEPTVTDNGRAVREIMEQIEAQYAGQLDVDLSLAYDLLQNRRRRWVIELLATADGGPKQLDLLGLSKEVAAGENEKPIPELTDTERKRVYVSLYQTHLPRLDQAGIVDFDHEQGTVTLRSDGRTLHQMQSDLVERCSGASLLE